MSRYPVPGPEELAGLSDEELERLAVEWRTQALRGVKQAYGVAHALEVELRQRIRASQARQLPPRTDAPRRRWRFWQADVAGDSTTSP
ncbi:hypothetical protein [Variovorax sp. UC74_104]|uniref:hypothetical protein n=1 Tax=Variovorax sp. UC74_104 TaxID=3374555 RepID=UPI0037563D0E